MIYCISWPDQGRCLYGHIFRSSVMTILVVWRIKLWWYFPVDLVERTNDVKSHAYAPPTDFTMVRNLPLRLIIRVANIHLYYFEFYSYVGVFNKSNFVSFVRLKLIFAHVMSFMGVSMMFYRPSFLHSSPCLNETITRLHDCLVPLSSKPCCNF